MTNIEIFLKYITFAKYIKKTLEDVIKYTDNNENNNITIAYNELKNLDIPLVQRVIFLYDDDKDDENEQLNKLETRPLMNSNLITQIGRIAISLHILFSYDNEIKILIVAEPPDKKNNFYLVFGKQRIKMGFAFTGDASNALNITSIIDLDLSDSNNIDTIKSILLKHTLEYGNIHNCLGLL